MVVSTYEHEGWNCTYRHKPPAPGHENELPLMLVHPVGIGLGSWFWEPFLDQWTGAEVFAPDLLGCGDGDAWAPTERGLFIPLDWTRGVMTLWRQHVQRPCVVVVQGGLAPVGVQLAAIETDEWRGSVAVAALVLASPPPWSDMAGSVPEPELTRNFALLSSPLGTLGYQLLRSRPFVAFFSDLFLFEEDADPAWLDAACAGATAEARWPVFAFNAGLLQAREYTDQLLALSQPTLVLSGRGDRRVAGRQAYETQMRRGELCTLPGLNVVPWEEPAATADAVAAFSRRVGGV